MANHFAIRVKKEKHVVPRILTFATTNLPEKVNVEYKNFKINKLGLTYPIHYPSNCHRLHKLRKLRQASHQ